MPLDCYLVSHLNHRPADDDVVLSAVDLHRVCVQIHPWLQAMTLLVYLDWVFPLVRNVSRSCDQLLGCNIGDFPPNCHDEEMELHAYDCHGLQYDVSEHNAFV